MCSIQGFSIWTLAGPFAGPLLSGRATHESLPRAMKALFLERPRIASRKEIQAEPFLVAFQEVIGRTEIRQPETFGRGAPCAPR